MAAPVANSYTAASGATMYCGRLAPGSGFAPIAGDVGVAGDSLTDLQYNSSGYRLGFPLTMFPPRVIFNAGWQGQTIKDLADRFQAIIDAFPSVVAWVIRIGTNGDGGPSYQFQFGRLFTMLLASGKIGIFHAVTPRSGTAGVTNPMVAENAWLKAQCDADPQHLAYIEDSLALVDTDGNLIMSYTVGDGVHMNGKGVYAQAQAMKPRYLTMFAHTDPRISDSADKYSSNSSSNQYVENALMAGTGGSVGSGVTGVAPTNWTAGGYGGGTGGVASIVAADAGDLNQTPWFRVANIVSGGNTHEIDFNATLAHPAIAADATIKRFDIVAEVRFNSFDPTVASGLYLFLNVGGTAVGIQDRVNLSGIVGPISDRMVLRTSLPRTQQSNSGNSATLNAYSANTMKLTIGLSFNGAQATSMGSIDIRCVSVRGQAT